MGIDLSQALKNIKFEIRSLLFDWGNTIMKVFPDQQGPMAKWKHVEAIEGAAQVLSLLSEKFTLTLVSNAVNSDCELVGQALKRVNLNHFFSNIFTPHELHSSKPSPGYFNQILTRLKLDPENVIMVGDDYEYDIIGAKQVGLWTIWFNSNHIALNAGYPYHDFEISSLEQIPSVLEHHFKTKLSFSKPEKSIFDKLRRLR
ncbi:MAG: HAD family hydrolase [bacterium]|nr:HAD family hydrolase [bacterium]